MERRIRSKLYFCQSDENAMNKFSGSYLFAYSEAVKTTKTSFENELQEGGLDGTEKKSMTNCCLKTKQLGRTCKPHKNK